MGKAVPPVSRRFEQGSVLANRSACRAWLSAALLHFDAHELHHMYPFVPGYRLHGVAYTPAERGRLLGLDPRGQARAWKKSSSFQNRTESGWEI